MKLFEKFNKMSTEVKASTAYTICSILTRCLSFITLPIFTRIMTTEEYGLATIYSSTAAIVVIFTSLQLPYGTLSTAMIRFKDDRKGYLSTVCSITMVLTLIYILCCFVFKNLFIKFLDLPFFLIVLMGIEMFFSTATATWMGYQRFEFKYKSVVLVTFGTAVLSVITSLVAVVFSSEKGIAKICSNSFVTCAVGLVLFLWLIKHGKKMFEKRYWRFALSFNLPLIPYYLSQVVFNQSDRLMINNICGRGDAAIYGVAYTLAMILTFVVTSIHSSYTPWIFERIDRNELQDNRKVTILLSSVIAFMLLGIIALAPEIIYVMAGERYSSAIWVVPPVAMSVLLLYYSDLFDCLLFFYEEKFFLAVAAVFAAVINILLNYLFIPKFGFVAAAYTTLASYLVLAFMDYLYMVKVCRDHNIDKNLYNIKGLVLVFLVFSGLGFLAMGLYEYPIIRYLIILIVFILLILFRNRLSQIYKMVRRK